MRPYDYQPSGNRSGGEHSIVAAKSVLRLSYDICDVFTARALSGNPLAVFKEDRRLPETLMQPIAAELNLSETVFLRPSASADARLRIFTPRHELPFAGHPTLGAAAIVASRRARPDVTLETGVGLVAVNVERDQEENVFAWMEQPLPRRFPFARTDALLEALGLLDAPLPVEVLDNGIPHVYVAIDDPGRLGALAPDMSRLAAASPDAGVACFARRGAGWKVRMFAPAHGVLEDPATGSAAGPLAAYLIAHGLVDVGDRLRLEQGAELGRPSELYVATSAEGGQLASIKVGGGVVFVGHGELCLAGAFEREGQS